ncbi:MAG: DUF805 domain-containing protein [Hyphomicrobiaceae bacterium]|nr:DUF805 domain-containing protein [Hyphomicrobiaceae bacterium]
MNAIRAFYSFSGRIGRRGFWAGILIVLGLGSAATVGLRPDILSSDPFTALLNNWNNMGARDIAVYIAMLFPAMALVTQRLHDRNKSGLVAALFWAPALIQSATLVVPMAGDYMDTMMQGYNWLAVWLGGVGTWFFVELGFYGPREPNKYGIDPRTD